MRRHVSAAKRVCNGLGIEGILGVKPETLANRHHPRIGLCDYELCYLPNV